MIIVRYKNPIAYRALKPDDDQTLLCWERAGEFCHRNLVLRMIHKHRPDCFGGADLRRLDEVSEKCTVCSSPIIPGLESSYRPQCMVWGQSGG